MNSTWHTLPVVARVLLWNVCSNGGVCVYFLLCPVSINSTTNFHIRALLSVNNIYVQHISLSVHDPNSLSLLVRSLHSTYLVWMLMHNYYHLALYKVARWFSITTASWRSAQFPTRPRRQFLSLCSKITPHPWCCISSSEPPLPSHTGCGP